jgi:hypothetical protein
VVGRHLEDGAAAALAPEPPRARVAAVVEVARVHRLERDDLPQLARRHERPGAQSQLVMAEVEADRERAPRLGDPALDRASVLHSHAERLLHEDVLAGVERREHDLGVVLRRRADGDRFDVGRADERGMVGVRARSERGRDESARGLERVRDGDDLKLVERRERRCMPRLRHAPAADDAEPKRLAHGCDSAAARSIAAGRRPTARTRAASSA